MSLSIIHLSDLHCTAKSHTMGQITNGILYRDFQDSGAKMDKIASYIIANRETLGADTVIITGDLTDSGDEKDYTHPRNGVLQIVNRLRGAGFTVFNLPGNHDYCCEGNQFLTGQFNDGEQTRRDRFIRLVTPQYAASPKYPHVENILRSDGSVGARLILLDSMQEELDGSTGNNRAQGTLGATQLDALSAKLAEFQAGRNDGVKVIAALHHSPFDGGGDGLLSDAAQLKAAVAGKVDCLIYGHVTRGYRYQGPRYVSPAVYEQEDVSIVQGQSDLNIPLINVENLEDMGTTLPITVLDVDNRTRSVYYVIPHVISLHRVICDEPATSFGDDLQIYVDNMPVTPAILLDINVSAGAVPTDIIQTAENLSAGPRDEMKIDKGQTYNLTVQYGVSEQVSLIFMEDGDPAGAATIDAKTVAGRGEQVLSFKVKDDGRYRLFYSIAMTTNEYSQGEGGALPIGTDFDLDGVWSDGSSREIIITRVFNALTIDMSAYGRVAAFGAVRDASTIAVTFPDAGAYTGKLVAGETIAWSNGSSWARKSATGQGLIATVIDLDGTWTDGSPRDIPVGRTNNDLSIDMTAFGRPAAYGRVVDPATIVVTFPDAGAFTGKLAAPGAIRWSNNSAWTKRSVARPAGDVSREVSPSGFFGRRIQH